MNLILLTGYQKIWNGSERADVHPENHSRFGIQGHLFAFADPPLLA